MLHTLRQSEIIGWATIDSATASHLGYVKDVWLDESGQVVSISSDMGFWPLNQIAGVGLNAITVYHAQPIEPAQPLYRLHQFVVQSPTGESLGWVKDFLFDWQTGEIVAYVVAGDMATLFGGQGVLLPEDVETLVAEAVVLREGADQRLKPVSEGLRGFLSEKPQPVKDLVRAMSDTLSELFHNPLHPLSSAQDQPEIVQVKIQEVSQEASLVGEYDHQTVEEAIAFLHSQWQHLQQRVRQMGNRAQAALDSTWHQFVHKEGRE
jgi:uncharacterized protein YrrD